MPKNDAVYLGHMLEMALQIADKLGNVERSDTRDTGWRILKLRILAVACQKPVI